MKETASMHIEAVFQMGENMTFEELKAKAQSLPLLPGVYIMRNKEDTVIYVGKAKKLRNRVSQYFLDLNAHSPKTRMMVSNIDHFDVFVASSEFEALVLECAQIKRFQPKYNILLKDDKGYPYIRVDRKPAYPTIKLASFVQSDGAKYYGPFGSRGTTQKGIDAIQKTMKLPQCTKRFPEDIGKGRPCLNYHLGQCSGWCTGNLTINEYLSRIDRAEELLKGNCAKVSSSIKNEMLECSEKLDFERAAILRDMLKAVDAFRRKQIVSALPSADTDVIGFGQTEAKACFVILHYRGGDLLDKEYNLISRQEDIGEAVSSLTKQYYMNCGFAPKNILLPVFAEDMDMLSAMLREKYGHSVNISVPQRGERKKLSDLAQKNALEEAERITGKAERLNGALRNLRDMLGLDSIKRMESYDISNISGTDMVGAMTVFEDGKPRKSDYRHFKIENMAGQNDYGCMMQVLERRFTHYLNKDDGFDLLPDVLLIDGGEEHAQCARLALASLDLSVPVFGMVKDDRHRTRALITPDGDEIGIDRNQSVFSLVGNIQEETHRFAISYHRKLRSKRLSASVLDGIPGIGPKRKQILLKRFGSVDAVRNASYEELSRYLNADVANAVYGYFHKENEK